MVFIKFFFCRQKLNILRSNDSIKISSTTISFWELIEFSNLVLIYPGEAYLNSLFPISGPEALQLN